MNVPQTARVGERLEASLVGRVLLTGLMVVVVVAVAVWNLPAGRLRDQALPLVAPVVLPLGLDQDWSLFAPDPRPFTVGVYARVGYADGREVVWRPPSGLSAYRAYRWQKLVERLRADDGSALWEPTARWLARELGPGVQSVALVRTYRETVRPGSGGTAPPEQEFVFYVLDPV